VVEIKSNSNLLIVERMKGCGEEGWEVTRHIRLLLGDAVSDRAVGSKDHT